MDIRHKFLRPAKRAANYLLKSQGHVIAQEAIVPSFDRFVGRLRELNTVPKEIIDVGVAYGTPWLYNAFPSAKFHLIDPTRESLPYMQEWAKRIDADIHQVAAGEEDGIIEINVRDTISDSSFYKDVGNTVVKRKYNVDIRRIDRLVPNLNSGSLVKIDVQGYELSVLRGMSGVLPKVDFLIIESSLISTLRGGAPEFAEIVAYMKDMRFSLYDFVGMVRRPLDRALAQVDAVFVPDDSILRRDRRWRA